jgi:pimeloyl-ACP methyl ester carboxylesterase
VTTRGIPIVRDPQVPEPEPRQRLRAFYLLLDPDPVLTFLHSPAELPESATGVVLCPTFGWEDTCSYRSRKRWAEELAEAGYPTVRIDFPGAGDSGGSPRDPGRLEAWTGAVTGAASWLRDHGCSRVAAIGIGIGGMVACRAVAGDAHIDDLVLWAVPARGTRLVRELRAFARLADAEFPDPHAARSPSAPEGFLNVSGFLLSDETLAGLEALNLLELPMPELAGGRVLLLGRDRQAADPKLKERLARNGAKVTTAVGPGYSDLMSGPQSAKPPYAVIERTISWLGDSTDAPPRTAEPFNASIAESEQIELPVGDATVAEAVVRFDLSGGSLYGVLAKPAAGTPAPIAIVLLNSGAVRRIGPNRMWVEVSRRWAALGVPVIRVDLEAIGDSDGDERPYVEVENFYRAALTDQVVEILDELERRGVAERFVLAGLCSGAYWAYHAALRDRRVSAALMINLYAFEWDGEMLAEREAHRIASLVRSGGIGWMRAMTAERLWRAARTLPSQIRSARRQRNSYAAVEPGIRRLGETGAQGLFIFSRGEPLHEDFLHSGHMGDIEQWPQLSFDAIPSRDHTFRAIWLQEHVHATLDRALERVLSAPGQPILHK